MISLGIVVVIAFGSLAATLAARWHPRLGLDLAGGLSVVYKPAHKVSQNDLNQTVTILTNRVNGLGVSGATVGTLGGDIVVQVPGVSNGKQLLKTIGETAQLYFRPALCGAPAYNPSAKAAKGTPGSKRSAASLPSCPASSQLTATNLGVTPTAGTTFSERSVPADTSLASYKSTNPTQDKQSKTVLLPAINGAGSYPRYLLGPAPMTGHAVKSAIAQQTQLGKWVVNYTLTGKGTPQWEKLAQSSFHQIVAIELDGEVYSAPIIQPSQPSFTSFAGKGEISGHLSETQAKKLAIAMQFGSLPVRLDQQTSEVVSPTLGHSALLAGLFAGLAGLVLVLLYTIAYYRLLGIVVVSGLAATGALLWAIISALGHTSVAPSFDLAGVTGIIVSIGITVDSYIVYFERLKDETRAGRTVRTSVDRGFRSAFRTVLAADFVSLLAAVLLYWLAVGEVKGFAFFLGLSTILDVVITYFFTRPLVALLGRSERLTQARRIGINQGLAVRTGSEL
ncbi:MAG: protein translocase subunit SecD [Candidatus Dormibacteraceae bacterium]